MNEIRIDERTWDKGSPARRMEWHAAIRELLAPGEAVVHDDLVSLHITLTQQAFLIEGRGLAAELATITLGHEVLGDLMLEYVDTVREMSRVGQGGGLSRIEALDMAKKVIHDKAARKLLRRCRPLGFDHPTARRLFTLLLGLRIDTTRLVGVHGHRTI